MDPTEARKLLLRAELLWALAHADGPRSAEDLTWIVNDEKPDAERFAALHFAASHMRQKGNPQAASEYEAVAALLSPQEAR